MAEVAYSYLNSSPKRGARRGESATRHEGVCTNSPSEGEYNGREQAYLLGEPNFRLDILRLVVHNLGLPKLWSRVRGKGDDCHESPAS